MSGENAAILILLASFFAMIILRFPIAYAVALSSVFCLLYQGLPLATICWQMVVRLCPWNKRQNTDESATA